MQFVIYTPSNSEPKTALKFPDQFGPPLTTTFPSLPPRPPFPHCAHPPPSLPASPGSFPLFPVPGRSSSVLQGLPTLPGLSALHTLPARPLSAIPNYLPFKGGGWRPGGGGLESPLNDFDMAFIENGIVDALESQAESIVDCTAGTAIPSDDAPDHHLQLLVPQKFCEYEGAKEINDSQHEPQSARPSGNPTLSPPRLSGLEAGDSGVTVGVEMVSSGRPGNPPCSSTESTSSTESMATLGSRRSVGRERSCRLPVLRPRLKWSAVQVMEAVVIRTSSSHDQWTSKTSALETNIQHGRAAPQSTRASKPLTRHWAHRFLRSHLVPPATSCGREQWTHPADDSSRDLGRDEPLSRRTRWTTRWLEGARPPSPSDGSDTVSGSDDDYNPDKVANRPSKQRRTCASPPLPPPPSADQTPGQRLLTPELISALVSAMTQKLLETLRGPPPAALAAARYPHSSTDDVTSKVITRKRARWNQKDDDLLERLRARGWSWWEIKQQFPGRTLPALQQRHMKLQAMGNGQCPEDE
ncbi:hypothetical protein LOZ65_006889 [Ophidiomyces ophidiicola]|nr:hypothetical protein LOZ65_006889 [Ophidiomyces ophidiicola]